MTHKPREKKKGGWAGVAILALVLLPVLYVLSVGPAYRIAFSGEYDYVSWLDDFYAPLWWAARHSDPIQRVMLWYTGWDEILEAWSRPNGA